MVLQESEFLEKVAGKKCMVVGDIMLDSYLYGDVSRISPEAPIPVVKISSRKDVLGGAGNVAANIRGYYMQVLLIGRVGEDEAGQTIQNLLSHRNIEFHGCVSRGTTKKTRVIGKGQQMLRLDEEQDCELTQDEHNHMLQKVEQHIEEVQVVLLSDYQKGVCTGEFCSEVIRIAKANGKTVIVDPKSFDWEQYRYADIIAPNFSEFCEVLRDQVTNNDQVIADSAKKLISTYNLHGMLVTRSEKGMLFVDEEGAYISIPAAVQEVYDVSGAGDTVVATIAVFVSLGYPIRTALEVSNIAAGIVIGKQGTCSVSLNEVMAYTNMSGSDIRDKIINQDDMNDLVQKLHERGIKIVFTNGCFDILHAGHIHYLREASKLGNILIIGLNTDDSVSRIKGEMRPINSEGNRALLLSALSFVDFIILFDEDTPEILIKKIKPDVLVKGGDYSVEQVIGKEYAQDTVIIPFLEGFSTTEIINKLRD